jgi:hypothetical protein
MKQVRLAAHGELQGQIEEGTLTGNHVSGSEHLQECEISTGLDLAVLVTVVKLNILDIGLVKILLTWPLKCFSPGLVTEPVANEISIASIDQDPARG